MDNSMWYVCCAHEYNGVASNVKSMLPPCKLPVSNTCPAAHYVVDMIALLCT